ncbi:nucleotide sugar dehydrogenase [Pseudoalteromonas sp. C2R02]|uniref:nucleotide sugar dehydrogenase n=1 Tax=Pseudoalteromonas sp. C2R02 TaxID=2841565 RepID=UPI001C090A15|nr:nucleotide sugar dehydrogenase [Pseudoalteromonas sp. C2R02]MBU2972668.1 nucleotide sugar dehydrogenase [Pseudoalteromonas sp. C2R02]
MDKKQISIFGLGYVGLVTSVCLAELGHQVIGVDINQEKIDLINQGKSPFYEPGLEKKLAKVIESGNFKATIDHQFATMHSQISMISVGTPSLRSGDVNLEYVFETLKNIAKDIKNKSNHIIVMRSTVPPGSAQNKFLPILYDVLGERLGKAFHYVSNPEFLRESTAIEDFYNPPETVLGCNEHIISKELAALYSFSDAPVCCCSIPVAECIKYVDNTWHALKVTFTNEIGSLCKTLNIDSHEVMDLFCRDTKLNISTAYFKPGFAFGGSCLPKDVRGLSYVAEQHSLRLPTLTSILKSNFYHIDRAYELVTPPGVKSIGLLGLAFKADTDDVRESPLIRLAERLIGKGYKLIVYDKHVFQALKQKSSSETMKKCLGHLCQYVSDDLNHVIKSAEVVVIGNRSEEFNHIAHLIQDHQIIVDLVKNKSLENHSFYEGICW